MDDEIKTWLFDILKSIEEIDNYFVGKPKDFMEYVNNTKTKRAVERNLEIIGEAVNRILKQDPNFEISHARRIIDTRNRIIHGYDTISDDLIWGIIINHLPKLKKEVEELL